MKKNYMQPNMREIILDEVSIIATSGEGGVEDGGKTGREYSSTDVSYSRDNSTLWDQEW